MIRKLALTSIVQFLEPNSVSLILYLLCVECFALIVLLRIKPYRNKMDFLLCWNLTVTESVIFFVAFVIVADLRINTGDDIYNFAFMMVILGLGIIAPFSLIMKFNFTRTRVNAIQTAVRESVFQRKTE
jgi:hypothetical protein